MLLSVGDQVNARAHSARLSMRLATQKVIPLYHTRDDMPSTKYIQFGRHLRAQEASQASPRIPRRVFNLWEPHFSKVILLPPPPKLNDQAYGNGHDCQAYHYDPTDSYYEKCSAHCRLEKMLVQDVH